MPVQVYSTLNVFDYHHARMPEHDCVLPADFSSGRDEDLPVLYKIDDRTLFASRIGCDNS
jgi:hypothetical protein